MLHGLQPSDCNDTQVQGKRVGGNELSKQVTMQSRIDPGQDNLVMGVEHGCTRVEIDISSARGCGVLQFVGDVRVETMFTKVLHGSSVLASDGPLPYMILYDVLLLSCVLCGTAAFWVQNAW